MKARDARALLRQINLVTENSGCPAAKRFLEQTPGALKHGKLRNRYADLLLQLDDREAAEGVLIESIIDDPGNVYAIKSFLQLDQNKPQPDSVIARYHSLTCHPTIGGVFLARLAMLHMARSENAATWACATQAIDALSDPGLKRLIRQQISSFSLRYGCPEIGERLIMRGRAGGEVFDALRDLLEIRRSTMFDDTTLTLFRFLTDNGSPHRKEVLPAYFDYLWQIQGASQDLLAESAEWEQLFDLSDTVLRKQRIALAYELGDVEFAAQLLAEAPDCCKTYREVLAVACLLDDGPASLSQMRQGIDIADLQQFARLYKDILVGTQAMERSFQNAQLQVAVVGNSPCGVGSGLGGRIDAHDVVIRFNVAPTGGVYNVDYGSRTDIHILPTRKQVETPKASDAGIVLFTTGYVLGRNRSWSHAIELRRKNKVVSYIPGNRFSVLARELGAPPSSGLRVISYLHDLRGPLPRGSVFGFSFTDQIGPTAVSSHYFEQAKPSMHHNWHKERMIFENLLAPAI